MLHEHLHSYRALLRTIGATPLYTYHTQKQGVTKHPYGHKGGLEAHILKQSQAEFGTATEPE